MICSNAPTDIKVYPIPGIGVEVKATFHQANGSNGTYARFQVSTDPNFGTTNYDSEQVAITSIADNTEGVMVFAFIPSNTGTYYYRLCFWDNDNYMKISWLIWNGTIVSTSSAQTATKYPNSDNSLQMSIQPTSPTTHYDKVDEEPVNTSDYIYTNSASILRDIFNIPTSGIDADVFKNISKVNVTAYAYYTKASSSGTLRIYCGSATVGYGQFTVDQVTGWYEYSNDWLTNPATGLAWTLADVNALIAGAGGYQANGASYYVEISRIKITITYYNYVFTFTPPGDNILIIGFPSIASVELSNDKDKYIFIVVITDTYTKPPIVTLTVGNDTEIMDYVNKIGSGPYNYSFSKTVSLERGDFEYHIEVGNVWTFIIDSVRFLHTNYNLNQEPKIEVFIEDRKINSWNHLLTENILPDLPEMEFDTDEKIQTYDLTAKFTKNDFKIYNMEIQGMSKTPIGYHIRVKESANRDLEQVVSFSSQAINSLSLLESLLPNYIFSGNLAEIIYLQAFLNERLIDILKRILILNNAIGYVRNKKIYLYDLSNTNALFKMNIVDAQIEYQSDPSIIINKVWEYYIRKMYPVPENILTNYDASNWLGTVLNVRQTGNGILPLSGSLYCLKGTGTIYRTIDFLWSDFDQLDTNWSPDVATALEIRLETDAANYRKYTRTYSGLKSAGFVLTGTLLTDIITKTITLPFNKYIHIVEGDMTQLCSVNIDLKLAGVVVGTSGWKTTTGHFEWVFNNINCDSIVLSYKNLYMIGAGYGVDCISLKIEEYKQTFIASGTSTVSTWHGGYSGKGRLDRVGISNTYAGIINLGIAPPLGSEEYYALQRNNVYVRSIDPFTGIETLYYANSNVAVENGMLIAHVDVTLPENLAVTFYADGHYGIDFYRMKVIEAGEWVWVYANYGWSETYNLWDSLSVPFSQFTIVGAPTNQINTVRLIATTDNYYDTIYFIKNNPIPQYVEVKNVESMARGIKFQERKTDGWSSKESALAFAKAFVNIFGEAAESYSKQMSMKTDIQIGDMVDCNGTILPVYKIVYDLNAGQMTVFVGRSVTNTLEFLKETSRKIEAIQKVLY